MVPHCHYPFPYPIILIIPIRLLPSRTQAALQFSMRLFAMTRDYTDGKKCWSAYDKHATLSNIPQLQALYAGAL
jgi:hypothetical protein